MCSSSFTSLSEGLRLCFDRYDDEPVDRGSAGLDELLTGSSGLKSAFDHECDRLIEGLDDLEVSGES